MIKLDDILARNSYKHDMLYINSTNLCLKDCYYCYNRHSIVKNNPNFVSFHSISDKLDGVKYITLLGGEPLLNVSLIRNILENTDVTLNISTGLGIDSNDVFNLLEKYSSRISLQISYDGKYSKRNSSDHKKIFYILQSIKDINFGLLSFKTILYNDENPFNVRSELEDIYKNEIQYSIEYADEAIFNREYHKLILSFIKNDSIAFMNGTRKEIINSYDMIYSSVSKVKSIDSDTFFLANGCRAILGEAKFIDYYGNMSDICSYNSNSNIENINHTKNLEKCAICKMVKYCGYRCPINFNKESQYMNASMSRYFIRYTRSKSAILPIYNR